MATRGPAADAGSPGTCRAASHTSPDDPLGAYADRGMAVPATQKPEAMEEGVCADMGMTPGLHDHAGLPRLAAAEAGS